MPEPDAHPVNKTATDAARMLKDLTPGPLAELRRMEFPNGAPYFWRFTSRHPETIALGPEEDRMTKDWMTIVKILAILTPRGDPEQRKPLHQARRALGEVLCDGGNPAWPDSNPPRPVLSERRLAQLLASRGEQKRVLFTRAMQAISRTYQSGSGINVVDIAWAVLSSNSGHMKQQLARAYYRRLDRAGGNTQTNQEGAEE